MGISDHQKIKGKHYIEYKTSFKQRDKWKYYYIQEHYVTQIDSLGLLNLAAAEGLHSYKYYPLKPQPNITQDTVYFAGKYLFTNRAHLLKTTYNKLLQYLNLVFKDMLRYQLYGIIFKADVVGFTMKYNKIVDEMRSFDETGKEIALHFIVLSCEENGWLKHSL